MTLLEIKFVEGKQHNKLNKHCICRCDECGKEWEVSHCVKQAIKKIIHFCSKNCANISQRNGGLIYSKIKHSMLERYGVEHALQDTSFKEKYKQTCLERYGTEHYYQSESFKQSCKQTCLERYGTEHYYQSESFKQSCKQTCLERHGVENPTQSEEIQAKIKVTCLKRYGHENPAHGEKAKEKIKQTCLERYGFENPMQCKEILSKNQRSRRNASVLIHWKTGVELTCVASYEVAFVNWCNANQIDFDWQIPHKMPDGRTYVVDAYIKDGEFADTWVEIKGWLTPISKQKWEWFHSEYPNSELWNLSRLKELEIL